MTMPQPRVYKRRPPQIEAMKVTAEHADAVAVWAGGTVKYIAGEPVVQLGDTAAHVGDFVCRAQLPDRLGPAYVLQSPLLVWAYQPTGQPPRRPRRR